MNKYQKIKKIKKIEWSSICAIILILLIIFGVIGFEIYLWITYGNKSIDEVPAWVWWFWLGFRR